MTQAPQAAGVAGSPTSMVAGGWCRHVSPQPVVLPLLAVAEGGGDLVVTDGPGLTAVSERHRRVAPTGSGMAGVVLVLPP